MILGSYLDIGLSIFSSYSSYKNVVAYDSLICLIVYSDDIPLSIIAESYKE